MIQKSTLENMYGAKKLSVSEIAEQLDCSEGKVNYYLKRHNIRKRTISEAVYQKHNPNGDPFKFVPPNTMPDMFLYGLGIGLFWGEGTKMNKFSLRLGNTDPHLIKNYLRFLKTIFNVDEKRLRFGLQIFSTMNSKEALQFWCKHLQVKPTKFYKITVTPPRGKGTYTRKIQHGVLTVYFNNKKLRDMICSTIATMR
jgi:hypothetical protein